MKHLTILALLLAVPVTGCISSADKEQLIQIAAEEIDPAAERMAEHVRFDVYTGRLVLNRGSAESIVTEFRSRVHARSRLGGRAYYTDSPGLVAPPLSMSIPSGWLDACVSNLLGEEWTVCQVDIASHDTNFGTYRVPAALAVNLSATTGGEGFQHTAVGMFEVTAQSPGGPAPAATPQQGPGSTLSDRLEQLDALRDAGHLTAEEYQEQRQRLLDSL